MVGDGEWATEGRTGLSIVHMRVGEEQAVLGSESTSYVACLAHVAVVEFGIICQRRSCSDDAVVAYDTVRDEDACVRAAIQCTLCKA